MNFINLCKNTKSKYDSIYDSSKKTFIFLTIILTIVSAIILIYYNFVPNTFFNCNSDDVVQYYPYISGVFTRIKNGTFSLYDTSLFGGGSTFSGLYYIPIDIFLLIAFILSFIMETEFAYWFSIILKVCAGALLMYYVLNKKNFKNKVCLLLSLVYASTALLQAYVIFPVYLGIIFYAPLGMIVTDMFFDNKKRNISLIIIPIFVLQVVLFDYYIAYMLLAFVSIYFVLEGILKNKNLFTKEFLNDFILFFSFILLGVLISTAILLPSFLYIMHQTSRTSNNFDNFFLFLNYDYKSYGVGISYTHYFTQLINFFIPNYPNALCLQPSGGYVREHASLYMTSGFLIYFSRFFFIKDKKLNTIKFFVFLLNLMFAIPMFSFIFSIQKISYVRWFFIPYTFNILACGYSSNYTFKLDTKKLANIIPMAVLGIGLILLIWVFNTNPDIFEHYSKDSTNTINREYFYILLIGEIVFVSLYLINIIVPFIIKLFNKNHIQKINFIPTLIVAELIFSLFVVFSTSGSISYSSKYTYRATKNVDYVKNNLDYKYNEIERINLYTEDKNQANADIMYSNVNPYNFFQSFYTTSLDDYQYYIHGKEATFWSRRGMYGYSLVNGPMLNVKYVISDTSYETYITDTEEADTVADLYLPSKYYTHLKATPFKKEMDYYKLNKSYPFIVYDTLIYKSVRSTPNNNALYNDLALLNYAYVTLNENYFNDTMNYTKDTLDEALDITRYSILSSESIDCINKAQVLNSYIKNNTTMKEFYNNISNSGDTYLYTTSNGKYLESGYTEYDLTQMSTADYNKLMSYDALYVIPSSSSFDGSTTNTDLRSYIYVHDTKTDMLYPMHYNVGYFKELGLDIDKMYVYQPVSYDTKRIKIYGFNYSLYDNYINTQDSYSDRTFNFSDTTINLSFTNSSKKALVIKLPLSYSSEWIPTNSNYKVVNVNAGFLGVIIPEGESNINITLNYNPEGYKSGFKITVLGGIIYITITSFILLYDVKKRISEA